MKTKIVMVLLAGTALLAACKGSGNYESQTADTIGREAHDSVKLVKTADMQLKVKNVQHTTEQIAKLTDLCGGMVMHHNMQTNIINRQDIDLGNDSIKKLTVFNTTAEMTIKVPSEVIEVFMDSLAHMGTFTGARKMDVEDRTLDYIAEKWKAKNREASVKLRSKIKLTQKGADSILSLKDDVVDRKISNLRTNEAAKFSTLSLALTQNNAVSKEVVASEDLSSYNTSFWVRGGIALANGWHYFSELLVAILNLWAFILAGAALCASIWYYHKRKKENKSLPAS
jgi:hypothetical protein